MRWKEKAWLLTYLLPLLPHTWLIGLMELVAEAWAWLGGCWRHDITLRSCYDVMMSGGQDRALVGLLTQSTSLSVTLVLGLIVSLELRTGVDSTLGIPITEYGLSECRGSMGHP